MSRLLAILSISLFTLQCFGQVNSYFVHFTDKNNTPYQIDQPEEFLTQRSITRRNLQGIAISEEDLPVSPDYIASLNNTGSVTVRYTSRWFNGAVIQATSIDAETVKLLPYVEAIEYIAPNNVGGRVAGTDKFASEDIPDSDSLQQFSLLGISELRAAGLDGTGKMIAILDGGFEGTNTGTAFEHLFSNNQVVSTFDFISGTENVYQYSDHGTEVLSIMGANLTDPEYRGISPGASYLLYITENYAGNVEYRIEEYWWLIAAEKADSLGADIINTSLGYYDFLDASMDYTHEDLDGQTAVITRAGQAAADRGIVFVTSAGNTGNKAWQKITFPGDIVDGLAVGSMLNGLAISGFSAKGLSADGRIKPDVMAIGSGAYVVTSGNKVVAKSGTSYTSPQIAGLAAAIWQAYPDLTALEVLEAMRFSANNATTPDSSRGYGIPSYRALVNYIEHLESATWASIYPNPVENDLKVYVSDPAEDSNVEFSLFNTNGQPILTSNLDITWQNNQYILDVSTLPRGIYVLNLQSKNNYSQLKFAKL